MNITKHFSLKLNAPLVNPRWSWGAVSSNGRRVVLRVWGFEKRFFPEFDQWGYIVMDSDNSHGPGKAERLRHIDLIRSGVPGELVICTKVPDSMPWAIKDFGADRVFAVAALTHHEGITYAILGKARRLN